MTRNNLGEILSVHRLNVGQQIIKIVIGLAVVGLAIRSLQAVLSEGQGVLVYYAPVTLLLAAGLTLPLIVAPARRLYHQPSITIHEHGLMVNTRDDQRSLHWNELDAITMTLLPPITRLGAYRLSKHGETIAVVSHDLTDSHKLMRHILACTIDVMLPHYTELYRQRGTVHFGALTLTRDSLRTPRREMRFNQMGVPSVHAAVLRIPRRGRFPMPGAFVLADVPNWHVLCALLERITEHQHVYATRS